MLGKKKWGPKQYWVHKNFGSKKILDPKIFWAPKKILARKNSGSEKILFKKNFGSKKIFFV